MQSESPKPQDVARFVMASGQMERVKAYAAEGRRYQSVGADTLSELFVEAYKNLAMEPTSGARVKITSDLESEYLIRQVQPPWTMVSSEIEIFSKAVSKVFDSMSDDDRISASQRMEADYLLAQRSKS